MTITTITVTYGRTINTGNYSSLKLECTLTVLADEDAERTLDDAWEMARREVKSQWERFEAQKGERP